MAITNEQFRIIENLDLASNRMVNVGPGIDGTDGVNLTQVQSLISASIPTAFLPSNAKIFDLRAEFGLNPADGSKTLAELGILESDPNYASAKNAWDNYYVPKGRRYGSTIVPSDFTKLDWGSACHMEAVWRGNVLNVGPDVIVSSFNRPVWPGGIYYLRFPLLIAQGGMEGKGPGFGSVGVEVNCTIFRINHNNWLDGGTQYSKGVVDKTPIRTFTYGNEFESFSYVENSFLKEFSVEGGAASWRDDSYYMSGVGWWQAGEVSTVDKIYASRCNNHGILVRDPGPAVVRQVSVFDNNEGGLTVDSANSLGNIIVEQISGDDNAMGNLYNLNGTGITFRTIKHETGGSPVRGGQKKCSPSIYAQGWVNIYGDSITHAPQDTYLPVLIYGKHTISTRSRIKIPTNSTFNSDQIFVDLTERNLHYGNGSLASYSGTIVGPSSTHPINYGSFKIYDPTTDPEISIGDGVSLTLPISIPVGPRTPIERGSIEFDDEGDIVARTIQYEIGPTTYFFDPNYTPISGKATGATGYLNLETGVGSITFTSNPPPATAKITFRYKDNHIGTDDGTGAIVGIPGVTGNVNYTTGLYNVTLPYNLPNNAIIRYSSNRVYGDQFSGPSFTPFEFTWKNGITFNPEVTEDWEFPITQFYGSTGRLGIVDVPGDIDYDLGLPLWDITGGLKKVFYQIGVTGDTQVPYDNPSVNRVRLLYLKFTNIGGGDIWIADNIRIDAGGNVYCNGVAATISKNFGGTVTAGAIVNNSWYHSIDIIPAAPFAVTEMFGKTGDTSAQFTTEIYYSDTNIEIY